MELQYNNEYKSHVICFHYYTHCNCNEKIIDLFNKNSTRVVDSLTIEDFDHIQYDKIKDKISNKMHVKKLKLSQSSNPKVLDLNVLKLLFFQHEIEKLNIEYNQKVNLGDIDFKNLKKLIITAFNEEKEILPLKYILPWIIKYCPNIRKLYIERKDDTRDENLEFITKKLIQLNKNLIIKLKYDFFCDYKEEDEKYINEHNLEKINEETIQYKLPNTYKRQKMFVTLNTLSEYDRG